MNDWTNHIKEDHEQTVWKVEARSNRKVEAIKQFRALHGAPLKEAKDVVEEYDRQRLRDVVSTSTVLLPNGVLNVITNGQYTSIVYTATVASMLRPDEVLQAVADAAREYSK